MPRNWSRGLLPCGFCLPFRYISGFYCEELAPRPKVEDHPLSSGRHCVVTVTTVHIRSPYLHPRWGPNYRVVRAYFYGRPQIPRTPWSIQRFCLNLVWDAVIEGCWIVPLFSYWTNSYSLCHNPLKFSVRGDCIASLVSLCFKPCWQITDALHITLTGFFHVSQGSLTDFVEIRYCTLCW